MVPIETKAETLQACLLLVWTVCVLCDQTFGRHLALKCAQKQSCIQYSTNKYQYQYQYTKLKYQYQYQYQWSKYQYQYQY